MNEQPTANAYLWNASGEPDEEIQRLESLLERFRVDLEAPVVFPQPDPNDEQE